MSSARAVAMREGLLMVGDHTMPPGRRHWQATASAFAITDYHGTPLLWINGDKVVGDMSLTMPKPTYRGHPSRLPSTAKLLWFEVTPLGGAPVLRTWWAIGKNVARTQRVWCAEVLDLTTWPERSKQLVQLMGLVG